MLQHSSKVNAPMDIVEIGGGSGRLAKDVLVCGLQARQLTP